MKIAITLGLFSLLITACIITKTNGFYIGYKELTNIERKDVVFVSPDSNICNLKQNYKIYAITGSQLKNCLTKQDTSIVYLWGPNCSSEHCILISACEDYCIKRKYKLFVVANYYDMQQMHAQNESIFPMLIANHIYYSKRYANALNTLFIKDLLSNNKISKDVQYKRFLVFKSDKLIEAKSNLFNSIPAKN